MSRVCKILPKGTLGDLYMKAKTGSFSLNALWQMVNRGRACAKCWHSTYGALSQIIVAWHIIFIVLVFARPCMLCVHACMHLYMYACIYVCIHVLYVSHEFALVLS